MASLLFLPDDSRSLFLIHVELSAEDLLEAIRAGQWSWPLAHGTFSWEPSSHDYQAASLGDLVIVVPRWEGASTLQAFSGKRVALTPRQRQIVQLLAEGQTSAQMARCLGISVRTVNYHVAELKRRLGGESRAQLVSQASAVLELGSSRAGKRAGE